MAHFQKDPAFNTPFGSDVYLRSTRGMKLDSRTVDRTSISTRTIDGWPGQKILRKGTVLAAITSGPNAGKVGPFQPAGTAEQTTLTTSGTATSGTYILSVVVTNIYGVQVTVTTAPIAYNATAAATADAVNLALTNAEVDAYVIGTGGPQNTTPVVLTWGGNEGNVNQPTINGAALVGAGHTVTPTTSTQGVAGATDGRGVTANIVGICNTFLPWQLMERDVEVAVLYEGAVVQANCFVYDANGVEVALDNTTAAAMVAQKSLDIRFRT